MKIKKFEYNPVVENTYLLYDDTGECVIIDPGFFYSFEEKQFFGFIEDNKLTPVALLLTHLHFDHIFGVAAVCKRFSLKMHAGINDSFLLDTFLDQLKMFGISYQGEDVPKEIIPTKDKDVIKFGNQKLVAIETPGHSPGSLSYYSSDNGVVFTGDVLFYGSIGRTDLPKGDLETLIESIQLKLYSLPDETVVYPGHGPSTTIGYERKHNPFVQSK